MKIVYLDMDGVLADFDAGIGRPYVYQSDPPEMLEKGFFRNLPVMRGAREAVDRLLANPKLDVYIATKPTTKNIYSTIEKYEWVSENFPELLKKIFMVCDKGHLRGDFLIDDDIQAWGDKFAGEFILFDRTTPVLSWEEALDTIDWWLRHGILGG